MADLAEGQVVNVTFEGFCLAYSVVDFAFILFKNIPIGLLGRLREESDKFVFDVFGGEGSELTTSTAVFQAERNDPGFDG